MNDENNTLIYLDYNASSACRNEVIEAMQPYWQSNFANPQAIHNLGCKAMGAIETARQQVRNAFGIDRKWVVIFTGSGTEANNLAIRGILQANGKMEIMTSPIEHKSVLAAIPEQSKTHFFPVSANGVVSLDDRLPWQKVQLVSLMLANNETGAIQPVGECAKKAKAAGVLVHCDAIQGFGRIPVNIAELDIDMLSISAHKISGPKGVGALIIRPDSALDPIIYGGKRDRTISGDLSPSIYHELHPIIYGGSHEGGLRAGTHNVPGIVGLGVAVELAAKEVHDYAARLGKLRNRFVAEISNELRFAVPIAAESDRIPNTALIAFPGCEAQSLLIALDMAGVAAGSGAACSIGGVEISHVMKAMGVSDTIAQSVIRFSLGRETTSEEIDQAIKIVIQTVQNIHSHRELLTDADFLHHQVER